MLTFTDKAKERVTFFLEQQRAQGVTALRVAGTVLEPKLWLIKPSDVQEGDERFDAGGFEVYLDPYSASQLEGATVDFVEDVMHAGFRVFYPSPEWDDPILQRVQAVLDERINPGVASHGGRITLVGREGDAVKIVMEGGCQGCGAASVTLRQGVERMILDNVPEVKRVLDATDHDAGENPYYQREGVGESPLG